MTLSWPNIREARAFGLSDIQERDELRVQRRLTAAIARPAVLASAWFLYELVRRSAVSPHPLAKDALFVIGMMYRRLAMRAPNSRRGREEKNGDPARLNRSS